MLERKKATTKTKPTTKNFPKNDPEPPSPPKKKQTNKQTNRPALLHLLKINVFAIKKTQALVSGKANNKMKITLGLRHT